MSSSVCGRSGLCLGLVFLVAGTASAATVRVDAFRRSHYRHDGAHFAPQNTYTGNSTHMTHSYFAFDLSEIEGMTVVSATLTLQLNNYFGAQGSFHQFDLYSVSSDVTDVVTTNPAGSPEGQVIWADLGSGTLFGSDTVGWFNQFSVPPDRVVTLNAAATAALSQAAGGLFAIGVKVPTAASSGASGLMFSQDSALDPGPWRHYLLLDVVPGGGPADPARISSISATNDIIYLQFEGLPVGQSVSIDRSTAILQTGWGSVHTFVPAAAEAGWSEPRAERNHAVYRLSVD